MARIIGNLAPEDDLMHPLGPEQNFNESAYYNFFDTKKSLGGWFRIGCPVSQVEKPAIKGAIWRVRRKDAKKVEDPWGLKMDWTVGNGELLQAAIEDKRFAVRDRAATLHTKRTARNEAVIDEEAWAKTFLDFMDKRLKSAEPTAILRTLRNAANNAHPSLVPMLLRTLTRPDNDRFVEHAIIYALIVTGDAKATADGLKSDNERVRNGAKIALEQMQRKLASADETMPIPPPAQGTPLSKEEVAKVSAFEALVKAGDVERGKKMFEAQKSGCTLCHRVGKTGAAVSQDLSKIGSVRSERDLLESILFPNASFARGFEPYIITTPDGEQHAGLIAKETGEAITLRNASNQEKKIFRNGISRIEAGKVSTMPGNYADLLTKEEIADLVAYLKSLK